MIAAVRMNAFNRPCIRRSTAWVLLVIWLFVLSAGVANACLPDADGPHGHPPAAGGQWHDDSDVAARSAGDHAARSAAEAPPLEVCAETPISPVKQAAKPDTDSPDPTAALHSPWFALPSLEDRQTRRADMAQSPLPGLPARLRYSRLAL